MSHKVSISHLLKKIKIEYSQNLHSHFLKVINYIRIFELRCGTKKESSTKILKSKDTKLAK